MRIGCLVGIYIYIPYIYLFLMLVLVVGSCGQVANFSVQLSKKQFA